MDLSSPVQVITGFEPFVGNHCEGSSETGNKMKVIEPSTQKWKRFSQQIVIQDPNDDSKSSHIDELSGSISSPEGCNNSQFTKESLFNTNTQRPDFYVKESFDSKYDVKISSHIYEEQMPLSHNSSRKSDQFEKKGELHVKRDDSYHFNLKKIIDAQAILLLAANKLYYSPLTAYLYSLVLIVNGWVLLKGLFSNHVDATMVMAECFVTFMLVQECFLRSIIVGKAYFRSFEGIFDLVVTSMCVVLLFASGDLKALTISRERAPPEEVEDILRQSLTAFRFSTQLIRMITLAMHHKRSKLPRDEIDFTYFHSSQHSCSDDL